MEAYEFYPSNTLGDVDTFSADIETTAKKPRSVPYEQYFGEMELTEDKKRERISLAKEIELMMIFLFAYINEMGRDAGRYRERIIGTFETRYRGIIAHRLVPDDYTEMYIQKTASEIVDVTLRHLVGDEFTEKRKQTISAAKEQFTEQAGKNDSFSNEQAGKNYFLSDDRAKFIAENEANSVLNYGDLKTAIFEGYTRKQWRTMEDAKVRKTHGVISGVTIGITELFEVGNSFMLFPRDISHGASDQEIVGCRCSLKYLK